MSDGVKEELERDEAEREDGWEKRGRRQREGETGPDTIEM